MVRHAALLLVLMLLASAMQTVHLRRAPVPSLDTVRFVQTAQRIDREGLVPVLRGDSEQPLFAVAVWAVHGVVTGVWGETPSGWAISAQWVAAAALVLTVIPLYFVSRRLVGEGATLVGCLLFCVLGEVSRLGADGISDSLHLFFFTLALWSIVVWMTPEFGKDESQAPSTGRPGWLLSAGVAAALALLTRVEVLVLIGSLGAFVMWSFCRPVGRDVRRRIAASAALFAVGFAVVFVPYLIAVDGLAPDVALRRALGRYQPEPDSLEPASSSLTLPDGRPMSFRHKDPTISLRQSGVLNTLGQLGEELANAFGYAAGLFALAGCGSLARRPARPVDWFLRLFALLFMLTLFLFATKQGYVSSRHFMPLVVLGLPCAGVGLLVVAEAIARRMPSRLASKFGWAVALLFLTAAIGGHWQPLHAHRKAHRAAADWLAENTRPDEAVLDTRGLTGLYSGRVTYSYVDAAAALGDPQVAYLVLECRELNYTSDRADTLRALLQSAETPLAVFKHSTQRANGNRDVAVYRLTSR